MCGISGAWISRTRLAEGEATAVSRVVQRMVDSLRHRGPDAHGVELVANGPTSNLALGHTRLAILDLSPAGQQPMSSEASGSWIVFNGEIYNFRDLRQELGSNWRSTSDTEVILRAYERWGRNCLDHLRGMFAFAIWDGERRELFLARDRLGIKPLYVYRGTPGTLLFGSEVRSLLASGLVPRQLDPAALDQYLTYQCVPAPRTLVRGVQALPPGTWLVVREDGAVVQRRYWDLLADRADEARGATAEKSRRRVANVLRESVALHLVSDVPVAAFLSGGIDSSIIVGLMRELGATPLTFSIAFPEREFDESVYAREVAKRFRTEHQEILLNEADLLEQLPRALAAMDQPSGDGINTYAVAGAVRAAGIKVALSGLGGDELFAGYPSFARLKRGAPFLRAWRHTPQPVHRLAARMVAAAGSVRSSKIAGMLATDGRLAQVYPLTRRVLSPEQRTALLQPALAREARNAGDPYEDLLAGAFGDATDAGVLSCVSYAEARTYMHDLLLRDTDQMSMAHSLEVRVPFLDHVLASYVVGLPDSLKTPRGTPKRLLVEIFGGLLPGDVVRRPKQGFTLPLSTWMRGPLRAFCEERLAPDRLDSHGMLQSDAVRTMWRDFQAGQPSVTWSRLWVLVVLEDWIERSGLTVQLS